MCWGDNTDGGEISGSGGQDTVGGGGFFGFLRDTFGGENDAGVTADGYAGITINNVPDGAGVAVGGDRSNPAILTTQQANDLAISAPEGTRQSGGGIPKDDGDRFAQTYVPYSSPSMMERAILTGVGAFSPLLSAISAIPALFDFLGVPVQNITEAGYKRVYGASDAAARQAEAMYPDQGADQGGSASDTVTAAANGDNVRVVASPPPPATQPLITAAVGQPPSAPSPIPQAQPQNVTPPTTQPVVAAPPKAEQATSDLSSQAQARKAAAGRVSRTPMILTSPLGISSRMLLGSSSLLDSPFSTGGEIIGRKTLLGQ